ncbi:glycosyltransferase family 2 protein [Thalassospira sp. A3_1]|uniref:glycosyltransferase family 2 protein n=1 Tax=Thalassospira sp. A3_1 TaxID=2821088 RepID=UPI001ADC1D8D|nr:glycosyltransferase family 2 protein [Thalassospira sp. A3_1]MBO9506222.1 glycosyltransferase [Thalassospira sp. A3_1]
MIITIITVCFNSSKTIIRTLDSVASQSCSDIEHIVIDGASTDGTLDLIKNHGQHVIRWVSEPDQGIYDAMNKGLKLASGDIIGFLNADDIYKDSSVLARVLSIMDSENLDVLFGDAEFINPEQPDQPLRRYSSKRFSADRIAWGWMPAHPTLFMRRAIYENFGLFKTDYHIAGDFELVARVFYGNALMRYRHISEVLVQMNMGGISTSGWRSTVLLNKEVLRACRENNISTNMFKIFSKYPAKFLEFINK